MRVFASPRRTARAPVPGLGLAVIPFGPPAVALAEPAVLVALPGAAPAGAVERRAVVPDDHRLVGPPLRPAERGAVAAPAVARPKAEGGGRASRRAAAAGACRRTLLRGPFGTSCRASWRKRRIGTGLRIGSAPDRGPGPGARGAGSWPGSPPRSRAARGRRGARAVGVAGVGRHGLDRRAGRRGRGTGRGPGAARPRSPRPWRPRPRGRRRARRRPPRAAGSRAPGGGCAPWGPCSRRGRRGGPSRGARSAASAAAAPRPRGPPPCRRSASPIASRCRTARLCQATSAPISRGVRVHDLAPRAMPTSTQARAVRSKTARTRSAPHLWRMRASEA